MNVMIAAQLGQSISQTPTTEPVPIVAVAMACFSVGLCIFCLFVTLNQLNQLRRQQKEHPEPILAETNNRLEDFVPSEMLTQNPTLEYRLPLERETLLPFHMIQSKAACNIHPDYQAKASHTFAAGLKAHPRGVCLRILPSFG
ncbi:uncharacterized protein MELLADRAFT_106996 [Melampsora larici-populina 98AG31]|uniref:Uncharacterized protein n=1 Tax=Melampsora larici-populina (strain 98AG31 / pathotype 3-4-7) TaxID=747676 RepID=F4RNB8_MELLP|nr:uncharacterized protein MELLADRAFT_106996 [Melampsora larici-populina 98AG31]EGG06124.1 hypothetical protein MELLADRAFT_106996 [Melampsora larici-populina 98AG31]